MLLGWTRTNLMYSIRIGYWLASEFFFLNSHRQGLNWRSKLTYYLFEVHNWLGLWIKANSHLIPQLINCAILLFYCNINKIFEALECLFPWYDLWVVLIVIALSEWWLRNLKSLINWWYWWGWSCCSILLEHHLHNGLKAGLIIMWNLTILQIT